MSSDSRLEEIEAKLAHQEHTISELSEVIYRQQQQLDKLERGYATLVSRVKELLAMADSEEHTDTPPPHY